MIDISKRVNAYKNTKYYIAYDLRKQLNMLCKGVLINGNRSRYQMIDGPFESRIVAESKLNELNN